MRESDLERKVVKHCKTRGILCYKFSSPAHRGVPDRTLIKSGKILFLELKSIDTRPTALQLRELEKLREQGMHATWCDNIQSAIEIIDDHFLL